MYLLILMTGYFSDMIRWLVAGLSLQNLGTDPCPVCVGEIVVD